MTGGWRRSSQRVWATPHESKPPRTRSPAAATRKAAADDVKRTETSRHTVVRLLAWTSGTERLTLLQLCMAAVTCEVMPQSTRCCSSSLSWWARTFSAMLKMFRGGLGKYSNQCWHQLTGQRNKRADKLSQEKNLLYLKMTESKKQQKQCNTFRRVQ